jgi:hypothetical protein
MALSPRAREIARKGAVVGLAGTLKAGDILYSTASGAVKGAQSAVTGSDGAGASSQRRSSTSKASSGGSQRSNARKGRTAASSRAS